MSEAPSRLKRFRSWIREGMMSFARKFPRTASVIGVARRRHRPIRAVLALILHLVGFGLSVDAVMSSRTPQGATAWAFSLNTLPLVAVPAYLVFGDSGFDGYVETSSRDLDAYRPLARKHLERISGATVSKGTTRPLMESAARISQLPLTKGNQFELLVDGETFFESVFDEVEDARRYVLVQFYIIRDDPLGQRLRDALVRKAREGVRVHLVYDDYGCIGVDDRYFDRLREAGVQVSSFMRVDGSANRFQLNFRNHRKLVVVDGETAFLGGHNVGIEYLGQHPKLSPWRDSSLRVKGPVVRCLQVPFVEDWMWATGEALTDLEWDLVEGPKEEDHAGGVAVPVATGPAEAHDEEGSLFFQAMINAARERIWIATPYFVPDQAVVGALKLAALRGVEVRILIPCLSDSELVRRTSYSFVSDLDRDGISIHRYEKGFLHQKAMLIDEEMVAIGSSNLDNRSLRLNFELTLLAEDRELAKQVEAMLAEDFRHSRQVGREDLAEKGAWFRFTVAVSRLLAPIQ